MKKRGQRLAVLMLTLLVAMGMSVVTAFASHSSGHYWNEFDVSADGSKATLRCYNGTESYAYLYVSMTEDNNSYVYDGKAHQPSFKKEWSPTGHGSSADHEDVTTTITGFYGTTKAGQDYGSEASPLTAAPTKAGKYTAVATITTKTGDTTQSTEQRTIKQEFTITQKPVTINWIDNSGETPAEAFTYNYDGEFHVPDAEIKDGVLTTDNVSVKVNGEAKTVATHKATAELIGPDASNYMVDGESATQTKTHAFTIAPKPLNVTWKGVGGSPSDFAFIYNGKEQGPTCELDKSGLVKGETCDIEVTGQQTNVGSYTATASLTNGNYTIVIDKSDPQHPVDRSKQAFTIGEYTIVKLYWQPETLVYNAGYQHPEAIVSDSKTDKPIDPVECGLTYKVYKNGELVTDGTKMPVGQYTVEASLDPEQTNFKFAEDTDKSFPFDVTVKEVEVALNIEDPIYYDADYHKPEITATGIYDVDKDTCRPAVSLNGQTLDGTNVVINDCNDPDKGKDETGVIHASSGKYTAKVESLVGTDSTNYVLKANTQLKFQILPKEVTLDWFRPAYNEYGDKTGGRQVKVDVAHGEKLNLVFNGKVQAPDAQVNDSMLLKNSVTGVKDRCTVTVSAPSDAIEARTRAYKVVDISFSNPDYTRDQSGADYYIIARPVKLEWDKTETTYNGEKQERTVEITNIQKDDRGNDYSAGDGIGVVKVSKITYTLGHHFGTSGVVGDENDTTHSTFEGKTGYYTPTGVEEKGIAEGTEIASDRIPTDAGTYLMTAAELSDPYNYTLVKINPSSVELDPATIADTGKPAYVDNHHPIYMIHQSEINTIDWSNTTVTYNASWQKPIVKVNKSNLKGPDTNKEVEVMITDSLDREVDDFPGWCNAKDAYDLYVFKNTADAKNFRGIKGDRCMNYFIGNDAQKMQAKFVINKRPLAVIANPKTIWYKDAPANAGITYKGLINGDVNTTDDLGGGVPGTYVNNDKETVDVVTGTPVFTYSYAQNGKPGTYRIYVSGLSSDNYDIQPVAGDLTVLDKYDYLNAKGTKKGKKGILVSWNGVTEAASYDVYMSMCNTKKKKYTPVYVGSTSGTSLKVKKIGKKKLKSNTPYKYYVVAKNSAGAPIAQSERGHFITNNVKGKKVNAKSMAVNTHSVTIGKGGTAGLSASYTKAKKGKKLKLLDGEHAPLTRFASENPAVATVDANGVVYGVGTGWTRVYVIGVSGMWETVEVYVQ